MNKTNYQTIQAIKRNSHLFFQIQKSNWIIWKKEKIKNQPNQKQITPKHEHSNEKKKTKQNQTKQSAQLIEVLAQIWIWPVVSSPLILLIRKGTTTKLSFFEEKSYTQLVVQFVYWINEKHISDRIETITSKSISLDIQFCLPISFKSLPNSHLLTFISYDLTCIHLKNCLKPSLNSIKHKESTNKQTNNHNNNNDNYSSIIYVTNFWAFFSNKEGMRIYSLHRLRSVPESFEFLMKWTPFRCIFVTFPNSFGPTDLNQELICIFEFEKSSNTN